MPRDSYKAPPRGPYDFFLGTLGECRTFYDALDAGMLIVEKDFGSGAIEVPLKCSVIEALAREEVAKDDSGAFCDCHMDSRRAWMKPAGIRYWE